MNLIDLIGTSAATLTTISFVPQVLHTLKTQDVSGISLSMYSTFTVGITGWLAYGWLLGAWPIIIANSITLALALAILGLKIRFRVPRVDSPVGELAQRVGFVIDVPKESL